MTTTKYVSPPHRKYSRFQENWAEMVVWWKEFPEKYGRDFPREVAMRSLDKDFEDSGQGISSSDVNHRVFTIWQSWMDAKDRYKSPLTFLVDYNYDHEL